MFFQELIGGGAAGGGPIGAVVGAIATFLGLLFRGSGSAVDGLKHAVAEVSGAAYDGLRRVIHAVKWLARGGLAGLVRRLWELYKSLRERIARFLDPVLRALKAYRDYFDAVFTKYVLPIINLIQRVRQVLAVFRLFGLKFAERLDAQLRQLQARIAEPFEAIRRKINEIINTIYLVLDPLGLIQPGTLILSAIRSLGELLAAMQYAQLSFPFAPASREAVYARRFFSAAAYAERRAAYRAGRLTDAERDQLAEMRARLRGPRGD